MKIIFRFLFLIGALFLLASCGKAPDTRPEQIVGLLAKSRDMLSFCVFLLNQDQPVYYNNVAERYYYAMLTLARIVAGPSSMPSNSKTGNHERIWRACSPRVQSLYGGDLKKLRIGADYEHIPWTLNPDCYLPKLRPILKEKGAFDSLKAEVVDTYENASARPDFIEECDKLIEEIEWNIGEINKKV